MGLLGVPVGRHWDHFGARWHALGCLGDSLGRLGVLFGPPFGPLGAPWGALGRLLMAFGPPEGALGCLLGPLEVPWGCLGLLSVPWGAFLDFNENSRARERGCMHIRSNLSFWNSSPDLLDLPEMRHDPLHGASLPHARWPGLRELHKLPQITQ